MMTARGVQNRKSAFFIQRTLAKRNLKENILNTEDADTEHEKSMTHASPTFATRH